MKIRKVGKSWGRKTRSQPKPEAGLHPMSLISAVIFFAVIRQSGSGHPRIPKFGVVPLKARR